MAEVVQIFAVNQGDDDRSPGHPRWFFESHSDAVQCAFRRGWYGGDAPIGKHTALIVDGKAYLLARAEPVELNVTPDDERTRMNAARAKLTVEERRLLGIN